MSCVANTKCHPWKSKKNAEDSDISDLIQVNQLERIFFTYYTSGP